MTLEAKLEALLFWKGEPMAIKKVQAALECGKEELDAAIAALEAALGTRGLRIMRVGEEIELRTAPEVSALIEKLTKDELYRDLGKAGLETLTIILYKSPIKRSEVDYIRGVNSSFIIRNLLVRGLIERIAEKEGAGRGFSYKPTIDLLAHLGISKIEDLPEYEKTKAELEAFARAADEEGKQEETAPLAQAEISDAITAETKDVPQS
ncbi:MAG: SMC-Scp complex subunit ScpB [Candidatus Taylorbacteria bacterium]|nr:SMC-Scp complex subunit ScpB [Candidatus Taylorbacteria bacterium]